MPSYQVHVESLWRRPARPLPITARPFAGEIILSYVWRLALINRIDPTLLLQYLADSHTPSLIEVANRDLALNTAAITRLAAFSGQPEPILRRLLPQIASPPTTFDPALPYRRWSRLPARLVRMCSHCAARRGVRQPVGIVLQPLQLPICIKHARLLTDYHDSDPELSPAAAPEVVAAARRHRTLARRRPHDAFGHAMHAAFHVTKHWRAFSDQLINERWVERGERLGVNPLHPAIRLPETIAFVEIMSLLRWDVTPTAAGEGIKPDISDRQRFIERLGHSLQHPDPEALQRRGNPLYQWLGPTPHHRQAWLRKPRKEQVIWD
ncbi:MAG TPA: hypothetical protein VF062_17710 [Candidatus Limnocylindrales bacterium]